MGRGGKKYSLEGYRVNGASALDASLCLFAQSPKHDREDVIHTSAVLPHHEQPSMGASIHPPPPS